MINPKEKAIELVEKIYNIGLINVCDYEGAKQCALIAVDEILSSQFQFGILSIYGTPFTQYWQEVKQEIKKL